MRLRLGLVLENDEDCGPRGQSDGWGNRVL
jgi:hypothetical protein